MKRHVFLFTLALVVAAALAATFATASAQAAKWTFAVYVDADNDLDYCWPRFTEATIKQAVADPEVNVVAMVDRYGSKNTKLYQYVGATRTEVASFGEKDFGKGATFRWFLQEVSTRFPADNLAVVMWDHGYGWRYICWDQHTDSAITMPALRNAITGAGVKVDVLGFDACNMGMAEVAYELGKTDLVDYVVGSEETIDQDGWPYDGTINALTDDPDVTPEAFSAATVDAWTRYYRPIRCFTWVSLSAIDVAKFELAVPAIQTWVAAMDAGLAVNRQAYRNNLNRTIYGWECYHVDLAQLGENLAADPAIAADLQTKSAAMAAAVKNSVVKIWSGTYADDFSGLAIWWGEKSDWTWDKAYYKAQVAFANDLGWYEFLRKWNAGPVPPWPVSPAKEAASRPFAKGTGHRGAAARGYPDPDIPRAKYGLTDVTFVDANNGWAVGYNNVTNNAIILRSTDGGANWTNKSVPAWWAYEFAAVKAVDTQKAWAVGSEGWPDSIVQKTTDGGKVWKDQSSKTLQYLNSVDFVDGQNGWIAGTSGLLLRTTDGGAHWTKVPAWTTTDDFWSVDFVNATHGYLAGGDGQTRTGFMRETVDGGASWNPTLTQTDGPFFSVSAPTATRAGYAVGGDPIEGDGFVAWTTTGGTVWNWQGAPPDRWLSDVTAATDSIGWVVGEQGTVQRTTDGGANWTDRSLGTKDFTAVSFVDADIGWIVGDCEQIRRTTDGGGAWVSGVADVTRPTTRAWNASCKSRRNVTLKYRVDDDMSGEAKVTLKITKRNGRVIRTLHPGWQTTGAQHGVVYRCKLKPGVYYFKVYATDEATNPQVKAAKGKLTVR